MGAFVVAFVLILFLLLRSETFTKLLPFAMKSKPDITLSKEQIKTMVTESLKLGLLEVELAELYEVNSKGLKMYNFLIPFTSQKTLILAKGRASLGYDLDTAHFQWLDPKTLNIHFDTLKVLSLDIKHHFVVESDTFLNRIEPKDRNQLLDMIREDQIKSLTSSKYRQNIQERLLNMVSPIETVLGLDINVSFDEDQGYQK